MAKARIVNVALLITGAASALAQTGAIIPDAIKAAAQQCVDAGYTPGIAIGVIDGERREFFFAGHRAHGDNTPIDERTVFEIGSITKVFTALALADAVERGEVRLDDPVQKLLPETVRVPQRDGHAITLLELARHRSALPRLPTNLAAIAGDPYANYTADKLYEFLNGYKLPREIGARYEYSNLAYGLLGHALARRAGCTYDELIRQRVCEPLGMKNTRITLTPDLTRRLARGHREKSKTPTNNWTFDSLAGCGALRSTVTDTLRFVEANLKLTEGPLRDAMKRAQSPRYSTNVPDMSMALGWHVFNRHGVEVIWHNGGTGGYHSFCGFDPKSRRGIVVLANSSHNIDDIGLHFFAPGYKLQGRNP